MDDGQKDVLLEEVSNQIQKMHLAELIQVADFVNNLKEARKFMEAP